MPYYIRNEVSKRLLTNKGLVWWLTDEYPGTVCYLYNVELENHIWCPTPQICVFRARLSSPHHLSFLGFTGPRKLTQAKYKILPTLALISKLLLCSPLPHVMQQFLYKPLRTSTFYYLYKKNRLFGCSYRRLNMLLPYTSCGSVYNDCMWAVN